MDSQVNRHVFSIVMWFLCKDCSKDCCWSKVGYYYSSAFKHCSIYAISSCHTHYRYMSCLTSTFVNGQLFMMHAITTFKCSSFCVASHISCVNMYLGMSVQVSMTSMFMFIWKILLCSHIGFVMTASPQYRPICHAYIICALCIGVCIVGCDSVDTSF